MYYHCKCARENSGRFSHFKRNSTRRSNKVCPDCVFVHHITRFFVMKVSRVRLLGRQFRPGRHNILPLKQRPIAMAYAISSAKLIRPTQREEILQASEGLLSHLATPCQRLKGVAHNKRGRGTVGGWSWWPSAIAWVLTIQYIDTKRTWSLIRNRE